MSSPHNGIETLTLPLPSHTVEALAWGPPDGPLVLALHGFPDTAYTWRHLGPHLADRGHRVVAPFMRGYAPSAVPDDGDYSVGALMSDAAGLHAALGGDERSVLVGHDWGALTANGLSAHPGSPFRKVVSMAVPPIPALSPAHSVLPWLRLAPRQLRMSWYIGFNQVPGLPERTLDRLTRHLWRAWSPAYDASEDLAHVADALADPANRSAAVGYYRAMRKLRPTPAYRDWHATWDRTPVTPMLYLHGEQDGALNPGFAPRVQGFLPAGSRVEVLAGCGHFLHLERPDEVNRLVHGFIEEP
jgi:pimeloyl-ACP methyl ester carboxylesterase